MQDIRADRCFIQRDLPKDRFSDECSESGTTNDGVVLWGDSHAAALYLALKNTLAG